MLPQPAGGRSLTLTSGESNCSRDHSSNPEMVFHAPELGLFHFNLMKITLQLIEIKKLKK